MSSLFAGVFVLVFVLVFLFVGAFWTSEDSCLSNPNSCSDVNVFLLVMVLVLLLLLLLSHFCICAHRVEVDVDDGAQVEVDANEALVCANVGIVNVFGTVGVKADAYPDAIAARTVTPSFCLFFIFGNVLYYCANVMNNLILLESSN